MSSLVESSKSKSLQNAISYVVRVTTAPFISTGIPSHSFFVKYFEDSKNWSEFGGLKS